MKSVFKNVRYVKTKRRTVISIVQRHEYRVVSARRGQSTLVKVTTCGTYVGLCVVTENTYDPMEAACMLQVCVVIISKFGGVAFSYVPRLDYSGQIKQYICNRCFEQVYH